MADSQNVDFVGTQTLTPTAGSAGVASQLGGQATTVSNLAAANNGIGAGNLVETEIDSKIFQFAGDDTPLMQLMLAAKRVTTKSPEVEHWLIDEPKTYITLAEASKEGTTATLTVEDSDLNLCQAYSTLLVKGVDGYDESGNTTTGKDLMLYVTSVDTTGNPIVRVALSKSSDTDNPVKVPAIPKGTRLTILANACYETQKEVEPDLITPQSEVVYQQKFILNNVISDYFESQKKRIPFTKALIAEQALRNFKTKCNRSLWVGRKGKFQVKADKNLGYQMVYTAEGIRWQFKRELEHSGKWTFEQFISLAKMYYTGEDVPKSGVVLCGKNFLENIQTIDWSKHPEVKMEVKTMPKLGWELTALHTVFGDFYFKREPTLDKLGYSNSAAIIGEDRLVHYVYAAEHSFKENIEGQEAKRNGIIRWECLCLKGTCHIWIDGEGATNSTSATNFEFYTSDTTPTEGIVYLFTEEVTIDDQTFAAGSAYKYSNGSWTEYVGELSVSA